MNIKPVSELRNYNTILDAVSDDNPVYLTKNGYGKYVVMTVRDYERLEGKKLEEDDEPNKSEIAMLKTAVLALQPFKELSAEYTYDNGVMIILDAVLSKMRKYEAFVKPRIFNFQRKYLESINNLEELVAEIADLGAVEFGKKYLDLNYYQRIDQINRLAKAFINYKDENGFGDRADNNTDMLAMKDWAKSSDVGEYQFKVDDIGISTNQYLRMLLGEDTVKPDRHVMQFITDCLGRDVSAEESIDLIEIVAKEMNVGARELDYNIWSYQSSLNQAR